MATRSEIERDAEHRSREQLTSNFELGQLTSGSEEIVAQMQSSQRLRAWIRAKFGYTDQDGEMALQNERKKTLKTLYEKNLKTLRERDVRFKEAEKISWRLLTENFVAVKENGAELKLSDNIEGLGTPTILDVLKEDRHWIAEDDLILKDWQEWLKSMIRQLNDQEISYDLTPPLDENDERAKAEHRNDERIIAIVTLKYRPKP